MKRWVCRLRSHNLDGPEHDGRIMCSRCGEVFNADMLRAFDQVFRDRGEEARLLPDPPLAGNVPRHLSDRELIEWAAQARAGDELPRGVWMHDIYEALVRHGFGDPPGSVADAQRASAWARDWVEQHPE